MSTKADVKTAVHEVAGNTQINQTHSERNEASYTWSHGIIDSVHISFGKERKDCATKCSVQRK